MIVATIRARNIRPAGPEVYVVRFSLYLCWSDGVRNNDHSHFQVTKWALIWSILRRKASGGVAHHCRKSKRPAQAKPASPRHNYSRGRNPTDPVLAKLVYKSNVLPRLAHPLARNTLWAVIRSSSLFRSIASDPHPIENRPRVTMHCLALQPLLALLLS